MRKYNFCAGPSALPTEVLEELKEEILDWKKYGLSVMEMSHRSKEVVEIAETAKQDFIDLLKIDSNYDVLFIQGGASLQFSMVPMNLLPSSDSLSNYLNVGQWSKKAIKEAKKYGNLNISASSEDISFKQYPSPSDWKIDDSASYLHLVMNETIDGACLRNHDNLPDINLVADCSSCILSEPLNVSKFALIYSGAQKNIGPAGLAIIIIRKDLLIDRDDLPAMMSYKTYSDSDSMYNTPPTFAWYLSGKVFKWLKNKGGLENQKKENESKASKLYEFIDSSDFYKNDVHKESRSIMNVPFLMNDESLNSKFLKESEEHGLLNLAGHRSVGGMRASIYNAVPEEGVEALIEFMKNFEKQNG
ncbi:MAG: 3-phosphoserine/phosphohydroxythreonine transaminase [Pseudomonadota bacterium]|nr:3-phosphoserine/phosphohydroxythreonine transaminase [Pseudomonadota bacterium]MEC8108072.1 3-phosphoserine/phosphohydroxythreonine transaminase [Pseudomonadota bacterium]MEC8169449.1 3-phosphoserine/phosphohydroxythreonine transaminase [Pseudomonadota bacterium]MEC8378479.1 3-phosphoserine/phosphohydroxythreonine transaminase [Pseudomonadota bacterium]MEC9193559.1 3-phosphoserine/phosphohydroxythreonine transaminase [Pseudomonadota bacterium]